MKSPWAPPFAFTPKTRSGGATEALMRKVAVPENHDHAEDDDLSAERIKRSGCLPSTPHPQSSAPMSKTPAY
jgi:hypothetical protein